MTNVATWLVAGVLSLGMAGFAFAGDGCTSCAKKGATTQPAKKCACDCGCEKGACQCKSDCGKCKAG
jgi:hypothetical protein